MAMSSLLDSLHTMHKVASAAAFVVVSGLLFLAVGVKGPVLESKIMPVWKDMVIEFESSNSSESLWFSLYGTKLRSECRFLEVSILTRQPSGSWVRAELKVDGKEIRGYTRPAGFQHLGIWTVTPGGDRVSVHAYYRCHDLWDTPAFLGEWSSPSSWR